MRTDNRNIELGSGFFVNEKEKELINNMANDGYYLYLRSVPTDAEIDVKTRL